jgi:hypothetical protein
MLLHVWRRYRSNTVSRSYTRCRKERDVKHRQEEHASNSKQSSLAKTCLRSQPILKTVSIPRLLLPRLPLPTATAHRQGHATDTASKNPSSSPKAERTVPSSRRRSHESGFVWLLRYQCEYDRPEQLLPPPDYRGHGQHYVSKRKLAANSKRSINIIAAADVRSRASHSTSRRPPPCYCCSIN